MTSSAPLLEARSLARHYTVSRGWLRGKGRVRALDGVSFSVRQNETLAVVGESGCGKSTLARQVTMIERPTSGELRICDEDIAHADRATLKRLRPRVQMVFQNPYASLNPRKQVMTLLDEPLAINTELSGAALPSAAIEVGAALETRKQVCITGTVLRGEPPSPLNPPSGCAFHGRCPYAIERCRVEVPVLDPFEGALVACHRVAEING